MLFTVPLLLWPYTSEVFEFNKMVFVYLCTVLIAGTWGVRMVSEKRIIFSRTILDIPLLIFFTSQLISTVLSIDPLTSWLGYYSRFNGGLASTICYLILYWAFVSNLDKKAVRNLTNTVFASAVIVSIYGVLEHLGIDKNIWQQDVQHRVFSTLGQPNWLAAWLVALLPLTWYSIIENSQKYGKKQLLKILWPYLMHILFFTTLIFTGSRSGLLGFAAADALFWILVFLKTKFKFYKHFLITNTFAVVILFLFGGQWIASLISGNQIPIISNLLKNSQTSTPAESQIAVPALESGGTESAVIRKIVWEGAIDIWKHYPIFGTGVETFAYSYYNFRPVAHNMTSEWDFIYNKAHNEYLNFMANSGTVGIAAYIVMVGFMAYTIGKKIFHSKKEDNSYLKIINISWLSGFISILVTNYFGFSVVPIQLLFFLYPAFSVVEDREHGPEKTGEGKLDSGQKTGIVLIIALVLYLIFIICRYWYSDTLYKQGSTYNQPAVNRPDLATGYLNRAINLEPEQGLYYAELSKSYSTLALAYEQAKESTTASQLIDAAIANSAKAVDLSPANVNFKRNQASVFIMLSTINPNFLINAADSLLSAVKQAPTDAKLYYNLGLVYARIGQNDKAKDALEKTVSLKPDYQAARLAYAILLIDSGQNDKAKEQLEYILTKISPDDTQAKQYLESIK